MSHTSYGDKGYWDDRYGVSSDTYEWYMPWATLKADIVPHIHATHTPTSHAHAPPRKAVPPKPTDAPAAPAGVAVPAAPAQLSAAAAGADSTAASSPADSSGDAAAPAAACAACLGSRILMVGCGNSEMSAHMYGDGFSNILSVDYSQVVIDKMRALYADASPSLADSFVVGDCRDLRPQCRDHEFDVILDKGTLDAILCGTDSNKHSAAMLAEMHRLMRPGGVMLVITYGQPTSRLPILERKQYSWSVTHVALGPTRYMYACKKKGNK